MSAAELAALQLEGVGAVASFTGLVRGDDGVTAIALEHYPAMTEAALRALAETATARWHLAGCTVIHRIGKMAVGEAIVLVATAAPHRAAALEACTLPDRPAENRRTVLEKRISGRCRVLGGGQGQR